MGKPPRTRAASSAISAGCGLAHGGEPDPIGYGVSVVALIWGLAEVERARMLFIEGEWFDSGGTAAGALNP